MVSVSMQCVTKMLGFLKENSRLINAISSDRLPKASFLGWFYVAYRESLKQHVKRYTDLKGILSLFPSTRSKISWRIWSRCCATAPGSWRNTPCTSISDPAQTPSGRPSGFPPGPGPRAGHSFRTA